MTTFERDTIRHSDAERSEAEEPPVVIAEMLLLHFVQHQHDTQ